MSSGKNWFIVQGDSQRGPFSSSELRRLASEGKVERNTKVWKDGLKQPVAASRIKGLFPTVQESEPSTSDDPKPMSIRKPIPQPSRAELRELVSSQKHEIAETALSKSTSHSQFEGIKERYVTLAKEVADLRSAVPAITAAGEQLKIAEQNVIAANKNVEAAKKELLANAQSLGELGFECLNVLPDSANDYFQPRQDLESKIQKLMQDLSDSDLPANATVMDKAKRKATQLKFKAQLRVEKLKIKSVNRQVGLALLESNDEELVRSDNTKNIIEIVASIRRKTEDLKQRSLELAGPLEKATQLAGEAVGQPVTGLSSFTRITKAHQKLIKTKDSELNAIRDEVVDVIVSDSSLAQKLGLAGNVKQLTDANRKLDDSPRAISVATTTSRNWFNGLSSFRKVASVVGLLIGFCFVGWWLLPNGSSQDHPVVTTQTAKSQGGFTHEEIGKATFRSITDVDPDVLAGLPLSDFLAEHDDAELLTNERGTNFREYAIVPEDGLARILGHEKEWLAGFINDKLVYRRSGRIAKSKSEALGAVENRSIAFERSFGAPTSNSTKRPEAFNYKEWTSQNGNFALLVWVESTTLDTTDGPKNVYMVNQELTNRRAINVHAVSLENPAVAKAIEAMRYEGKIERSVAASELGKAGIVNDLVVDALRLGLIDVDSAVVWSSAKACLELQLYDLVVDRLCDYSNFETLLPGISEPNEGFSEAMVEAVILKRKTNRKESNSLIKAGCVLMASSKSDAWIVPMTKLLTECDQTEVKPIIKAMGMCGPNAKSAIPSIKKWGQWNRLRIDVEAQNSIFQIEKGR